MSIDKIYGVIEAVNKADIENLRELLKSEINLTPLSNENKFVWHIKRNLLPDKYNDLSIGSEMLKMLVEAGCNVPEINDDYEEYSLCRIESEEPNIFDSIRSVDIKTERFTYKGNKNPKGALWHAASPEALKRMIAEGSDVNLQDSAGWTALHHIIYDCVCDPKFSIFKNMNLSNMIEILLNAGADVNIQSKFGITPLMLAAMSLFDPEDIVKVLYIAPLVRLLLKYGADASIQDDEGNDLKYWSSAETTRGIKNTKIAFIDELERYSQKNSNLSEDEFSMFCYAIIGKTTLLRKLFERNPDININVQNKDGYTALMFAASNDFTDNVATVELLLSKGADTNLKNKNGETLLLQATSDAYFIYSSEIIEILLSAGANPNISEDKFGGTPLMTAAEFLYDAEIIMKLIQVGADVNAQDYSGNTPLLYSACDNSGDHYSVSKCLLEHGADPSIKNYKDWSVLDVFLMENIDSDDIVNIDALKLFLQNYGNNITLNSEISKWQDINHFADFRKVVNRLGLNNSQNSLYSSWEDVITNTKFEDLKSAMYNNDFDWKVEDINGINFLEAVVRLKNLELLKICVWLADDGYGMLFVDLFRKLMNNYDIEGIELLLAAEFNIEDFARDFLWHFVKNYIPEANDPQNENTRKFKDKLDKGTAILNLLHEFDSDIPNLDFDGNELSYTQLVYSRFAKYDKYEGETIPVTYSEAVKLRRAVSPMAVAEIIDKLPRKPKRKGLRVNKEAIRRALSPGLFAVDMDELDMQKEEDNEIVD